MWHAFGSAAGHVGKSMPKPILACVPGSVALIALLDRKEPILACVPGSVALIALLDR